MSNLVYNRRGASVKYECLREELTKKGLLEAHKAPLTVQELNSRLKDMPCDTPSLVNRDTLEKNLQRILKSMNGFDGRVWNPPKAARVKSENGQVYLYDGDHSRHLYRLFNPKAKTMPMVVIDVEEKADVHSLFVQANCKGRTNITAEQIFVHQYLAGEEAAVEIEGTLRKSGLKVYCSKEKNGTAGDQKGHATKIGGVRRAMKIIEKSQYDVDVLRDAVEMLVACLPESWDKNNNVPAELLGGLVHICGAYKELGPGTAPRERLVKHLIAELEFKTPRQVAENFKQKGGSMVNHGEYSVARGIIKGINECHESFALQKRLRYRMRAHGLSSPSSSLK